MAEQYSWKPGAADFRKYDPQPIGEEVERLRVKHGELDPGAIVEEAKNKRSALHPLFPWDDEEAARLAREQIARRLLRSIHVRIERPHAKPIDTRAFVSSAVNGKARHYTSATVALEDEEGRAYLIREAWLQLKAWRRRYAELTELAEVFDAIDREAQRRAS